MKLYSTICHLNRIKNHPKRNHRIMKRILTFCLLLFVAAGAGCAAKKPILEWQKHLTQYIAQEGNGDPSIMRDALYMRSRRSLRPSRITFMETLSDSGIFPFGPKKIINGVLIDLRRIRNRDWFFFLVGISSPNDRGIEDVRLVGFTSEKTKLHWCVSDHEPEVVLQYLETLQNDCLGATPDRFYVIKFPSPLDVYSLDVSDNTVKVTERRSGATWKLLKLNKLVLSD